MDKNNFLNSVMDLKKVSKKLAVLNTEVKNCALMNIAQALEENSQKIFDANHIDLENAKILLENGEISNSMYNRLKLDENKFRDMIKGIIEIYEMDNPIGKVLLQRELDEGLILSKISCPIGVLGVIFEARPDVISQICALAVKTSNAVILKGGKEAVNTNTIIFNIINLALNNTENYPENTILQLYTRDEIKLLLDCDKYIDLIIPRGSNQLVQFIKENTKIPVLGHSDGVCHIYVDKYADLNKATDIIIDAKTQYPSACNAVETLLIHENFTQKNELLDALKSNNIEIVLKPESWHKEYSDNILSVKEVKSLDEAIEHINTYSSSHTDCIITESRENAQKFLTEVDSSGVYHNVSTRFADGFRYGFGAEVGISANKTHARGPVGLEGLTIYKYTLQGYGNIVKDYVNGTKTFKHKDLL